MRRDRQLLQSRDTCRKRAAEAQDPGARQESRKGALSLLSQEDHLSESQPLLTVAEACDYLRISRPSLYRLVKHQGLPCVRITSDMRFRLSDIEKWIESRVEE